MIYYNEFDPKAAAWLRELIRQGHLPDGDVDERSIDDVRPNDLNGYTQCHFFAGIGGWSYALRLAGWPDDRPVWTGSCPCQPFSQAGARKGTDDPRHLWPAFRWLIDQCRPTEVFGEQVASKAGREWLAGVRADLEVMGYGVGAADLCAASVGAPHTRQRLFWVADTQHAGHNRSDSFASEQGSDRAHGRVYRGGVGGLVDPDPERCDGQRIHVRGRGQIESRIKATGSSDNGGGAWESFWSGAVEIPCMDGKTRRIEPGLVPLAHGIPARVVRLRGYGNAIVPQLAAEVIRAVM